MKCQKKKNKKSKQSIAGFIVMVNGCRVAWFADQDAAVEWSRENYFGQWLLWPCSMPTKALMTRRQLLRARACGKELSQCFKESLEAD